MGQPEERCAFSDGPYLSASTSGCLENNLVPSCPDPRAVAGAQGEGDIFSSSRVTWNQIGLSVSALGLPTNQK